MSTTLVTICGSTRFMAAIELAAQRETLAGREVLRPEINMRELDPRWQITDPEATKARLDELHRAKIRRADEVLFVCPGGYMGESTRAELAYAQELGKPIRIEPEGPLARASAGPVDLEDPIQKYRELLADIWLYVNWRYVTKQLTTDQKNLWADAVEQISEFHHPGDGAKADRWWTDTPVVRGGDQ